MLGRRASTFHTVLLKCCIQYQLSYIFLLWFTDAWNKIFLFCSFYQNSLRRRPEEKLESAKILFFKNYLLLQIFFSWGSVYSNFGVFIPKISLFDVFSGFNSKHHLLMVLSTFVLTMICRKNVVFWYLSLSSCPSHMFYFKWHVFFPKCS